MELSDTVVPDGLMVDVIGSEEATVFLLENLLKKPSSMFSTIR